MSNRPSLNFNKVVKLVKEAGFELDHTKKRVTVPRHNKDLPKGTLLTILKQAGIEGLAVFFMVK